MDNQFYITLIAVGSVFAAIVLPLVYYIFKTRNQTDEIIKQVVFEKAKKAIVDQGETIKSEIKLEAIENLRKSFVSQVEQAAKEQGSFRKGTTTTYTNPHELDLIAPFFSLNDWVGKNPMERYEFNEMLKYLVFKSDNKMLLYYIQYMADDKLEISLLMEMYSKRIKDNMTPEQAMDDIILNYLGPKFSKQLDR